MKTLIFLTLSSLLFFISACNKKSEEGTLVEFRRLPALKCCNIEQAPAGKEAYHVIKSQREYQTLLGCRANAPDINFNKEFVLAGWRAYMHCASKKNEDVRLVNDRINYKITVERGECTSLDTVFFMVALPVRLKGKSVSFSIID